MVQHIIVLCQLRGWQLKDDHYSIVFRYTADEELDGTEASLLPGFVLIAHADLVQGPARPAALADCEVRHRW